MDSCPNLVGLQNKVMDLPGVRAFIRSANYYPVGDEAYVSQVKSFYKGKMVIV